MKSDFLENIDNDIKEILNQYIEIESFTNSIHELKATDFLIDYFSKMKYFQKNPNLYGTSDIRDDVYDRKVFWAMIKGTGEKTVVLIHHYDVVGIEDYRQLKDKAFSMKDLKPALKKIKSNLDEDTQNDINSGEFLFGHGAADMKGGGSIQIALMKKYSELENISGNLLLLIVPDEESYSAGMLHATTLLKDLKGEHNLNYRLMINSEPHQRKNKDNGMFSIGSVGKALVSFYVRGHFAHGGKVFEGLNPLNIMSAIVRKTEVNMDLADIVEDEASPAPTWNYLKDNKDKYDVSMPPSISGCCSILTLESDISSLIKKIKSICQESFDEVIEDLNHNWERFTKVTGREANRLPWQTKISSFADLYEIAKNDHGDSFIEKYNDYLGTVITMIRNNELTFIDGNFKLVEFLFDHIDDISPRIVYGLIPPYYPAVTNSYLTNLDDMQKTISQRLQEFTLNEFNVEYHTEKFFTGVSDLSYASFCNGDINASLLEKTMPLYGAAYSIPFDSIKEISMPVINIGPWGKEYHTLTERVNIKDLFEITPQIIHKAISDALDN